MRKIEIWTEIQELNNQGEYCSVEVQPKPEVPCAGVFQLQQVRHLMLYPHILVRRGGRLS